MSDNIFKSYEDFPHHKKCEIFCAQISGFYRVYMTPSYRFSQYKPACLWDCHNPQWHPPVIRSKRYFVVDTKLSNKEQAYNEKAKIETLIRAWRRHYDTIKK